MDDSFKDPNFNIDDWINSNMGFKENDDVKRYEDIGNQLLVRLQMTSRDISDTTDQNIRGLVEALPQAMAKLKHISSTVNDLSDSLRQLTNSGYKFKSSGNAPDNISELTSLKVRRDRLKDAADKLKHGIEIEADLQQLQAEAAIGDLRKVCLKYQSVSKAAESLAAISKFHTIKNSLQLIQKTIANRISPELNSACLRMNSDTFSKYAEYSVQIDLENLPVEVIFKTFQQQIEKERNTYDCDPPLPITDWLPFCLNKCNDYRISFSKWTKSIGFSIDSDLLRSFSDVLSPSIDNNMKNILSSSKFDDLVTVFGIISEFANNKIGDDSIFKDCITKVQISFPDVLQVFLNSTLNLPQTMPKSNSINITTTATTTNLSKNPPPSPSKSIESIDSILSSPSSTSANRSNSTSATSSTPANRSNYDPKLLETCITVSARALEWVKALARDPIRCVKFITAFLQQSISIFTTEMKRYLSSEASKLSADDEQQIIFTSKLLLLYTSQEQLEKKLKILESNIKKISEDSSTSKSSPTASPSMFSLQSVKNVIENQILETMASKSLQLLSGIRAAAEWAAQGEDDMYETFDQSQYVKSICRNIMSMLQQLTQGKSLSNDMIGKWTTKTAETVVRAYAAEIAAIPRLSKHGMEQLKADLEYLLNLLGVMGLEGGKDLNGILAVLSAEEGDRKRALEESGVALDIVRGLSVSLAIA